MQITPARVASALGGASALAAGIAPAVADLDTTSTIGVLGGALGVLIAVDRFLVGQRAHEARQPSGTPVSAQTDRAIATAESVVTHAEEIVTDAEEFAAQPPVATATAPPPAVALAPETTGGLVIGTMGAPSA